MEADAAASTASRARSIEANGDARLPEHAQQPEQLHVAERILVEHERDEVVADAGEPRAERAAVLP